MTDDFRDLLAVYALDALDAGEVAEVEAELARNPEARQALDEFRETMSFVADEDTLEAPSPEVWNSISAQLDSGPVAQATESPRLTALPSVAADSTPVAPPQVDESTNVRSMADARRRFNRPAASMLAVAAAAVVALGLFSVSQQSKISDLESDLAAAAPGNPVSEIVLSDADGTAIAALASYGDGVWELDARELPALADDRAYQLWGVVGDQVVSAGVFGSDPDVVRFTYIGDASQFVLTEEPAGGVAVATGALIAASQLA